MILSKGLVKLMVNENKGRKSFIAGALLLTGGFVSGGLIVLWIKNERAATAGIERIFKLIPEEIFLMDDFRKGATIFSGNPESLSKVLPSEYARFNEYTASYLKRVIPDDVAVDPELRKLLDSEEAKKFLEAFKSQQELKDVIDNSKERIMICAMAAVVGIIGGIVFLISGQVSKGHTRLINEGESSTSTVSKIVEGKIVEGTPESKVQNAKSTLFQPISQDTPI